MTLDIRATAYEATDSDGLVAVRVYEVGEPGYSHSWLLRFTPEAALAMQGVLYRFHADRRVTS